jgi:Fe2+ transport system protein FeoA
MTTLRDLEPGQRAVVLGWRRETPPMRLLEMGLLEGTEVQLVRFAPLGDPIDIKVRGYHMSLRRHEAGLVEVDPGRLT